MTVKSRDFESLVSTIPPQRLKYCFESIIIV